jgi:glycosyltransferase involved in cell wall biosynthesis
MPLISVIIPVYNGEKTIKETLDSVLKQTFQDFELIIINDGSQDATVEIVEGIQEPRIKLYSYSNAGQAASRNRGISHAVGEFIAFLDADDLWTADKLEAQLKALQANPEAAVAYSWTDYIDESNQFLRRGSYISVTGDVYKNLLVVNFLENGSNPLIRAQALAEVGYFDEALPPAEDWDMWLRLAARYQFVAVPSPQILYRQSSHSMSSNIHSLAAESLEVIERGFIRAPESLQYLKKQSLTNIYKYLTFKALEGPPDQRRGLVAARFFWQLLINEPELLGKRFTWKVLLKIALWVFLPPQLTQRLMRTKFKTLSHSHTTLLMHFQIDPS